MTDPRSELADLIGARLRLARTSRDLSVGALAAAAGIGKGSLSEIENATRNPNLSTLYALASALDVPLSWLLAEQTGAEVASPGITARLLDARTDPTGTLETYLLDLEPTEHRSAAHGTGVVEQLMVVAGRARVGPLGRECELGPGESTSWVSDTEHSYRALTAPARALLAIHWPGAPAPGQ